MNTDSVYQAKAGAFPGYIDGVWAERLHLRFEDLATASRILSDQGVFDAAGHVSMRDPRRPDRFYMSRSLAPALVTADDIMEFTLECEPCDARGRVPFIERHIHGGIYRRRPDVMAVAHGHTPSVVPFGLVGSPMLATYHNAAFLAAGVPVFDIRATFGSTDIVIKSPERGAALAEALGDKAVLLLRAHGFVAVGPPYLEDGIDHTEMLRSPAQA